MKRALALIVAFLASCAPVPDSALPSRAVAMTQSLPVMKQFTSGPVAPTTRSNREIAQDFLDLSFRMESGRSIPVMTRFEGPITVRVAGAVTPTLISDLTQLLARLRNEAGIDIRMTNAPQAAITVEAVPNAVLQRAVPRAACFVVPRISSWDDFRIVRRTPQVDWTTLTRRDRAAIFVPADVAPQEIRDCLHEELAQALGPLNDLYRLPDSVFNDDNIHAVLTAFDMLVLRAYYAPELRNGMARGEAAVRLPALLSRLNPGGDSAPIDLRNDTPRNWIDAMEKALANGATPAARRRAAEDAINLSRVFGWHDNREGFAYYAYGRLQVGNDPALALASFNSAQAAYHRNPNMAIHAAHIALQISAFALASGNADQVIALSDNAMPVAAAHQNAALLASLMMFKAEALSMQGRDVEAQDLRLDSLGWARYGFGSETNVQARLNEIAALRPY